MSSHVYTYVCMGCVCLICIYALLGKTLSALLLVGAGAMEQQQPPLSLGAERTEQQQQLPTSLGLLDLADEIFSSIWCQCFCFFWVGVHLSVVVSCPSGL